MARETITFTSNGKTYIMGEPRAYDAVTGEASFIYWGSRDGGQTTYGPIRHSNPGAKSTLDADGKAAWAAHLEAQADAAIRAHAAIAFSSDNAIADWRSTEYRTSKAAVVAAFQAAWPDVNADDAYDVWAECSEPAAHCAQVVRAAALADAELAAQESERGEYLRD